MPSYLSWLFFCIENQTNGSDYPWFARGIIFNLATQSRKIPFKEFKVTVRGVIVNLTGVE